MFITIIVDFLVIIDPACVHISFQLLYTPIFRDSCSNTVTVGDLSEISLCNRARMLLYYLLAYCISNEIWRLICLKTSSADL